VERAGRGQGGIAQIAGASDGYFGIVGSELVCDGAKMDGNAGCCRG
jgi:hypothetical protein